MSSGPSSGAGGTSTSRTGLPGWEQGFAKDFLGSVFGQVFPGAQLPGSATGGGNGKGALANGPLAPQAMPAGLNYQTAPFSPAQQQAMNLGTYATQGPLMAPGYNPGMAGGQGGSNLGAGGAQGLANLGALSTANFAAGNQAGPNPVLSQYFNSQAAPLISNYALGTNPALMAEFQQAGAFNSSGFNQAQGLAQQGLGQSLASLGTGIAVPAYEQGQQLQLSAAQGLPSSVQGLYAPSQNLYGIGAAQQQQQQNQLNTAQQNAAQQANWPYQQLGQLGGALGQAGGGGGISISQPSSAGGKGSPF